MDRPDIIALLDQALVRADRDAQDERGPWRISAAHECDRRLALSLRQWIQGEPAPPPTAKELRTFGHGTAVGAWLEGLRPHLGEMDHRIHTQSRHLVTWDPGWSEDTWDAIRYAEIGTPAQGMFTDPTSTSETELAIRGSSDLALWARSEAGPWRAHLYDFKTANPASFKFKKGAVPDGSYAMQLGLYAKSLVADHPQAEIADPALVYYNKGYDDMTECVLPLAEAIAAADLALERFARCLYAALLDLPLPGTDLTPRTDGKLPWQCSYCPHTPLRCGAFGDHVSVRSGRGDKPEFHVATT